jgi:transcriptional regulator with PAS, ATPase and Fis domain
MAQAASAANSDSTLLLLGESGTGKDYLARYVHDHSKRSGGQFFAVNCAAVASELAEAELFGHESGAFTGASRRKRGLLELAEGGTLLLNEIGDLSLALQAKLLSFLDTSSFTRVGGEANIRVNARIIAATNRDLHKEIEEGRFRLDLFYRLNVLSITVPPLRERREDLPLLVEQLLSTLVSDLQLGERPRIADLELHKLADYDWPGNVRQLRNVLERALILSREQGNDLSFGPLGPGEPHSDEWSFTVKLNDRLSINDVANQVKRALITETLARSQGNRQVAAHSLGISRFALFRMMKALNMQEN